MRATLTAVAVSMFLTMASLAAAQTEADWTVVSRGETDSRIQRQLTNLATQHGAKLRLDQAGGKAKIGRSPGSLLIELNPANDVAAFLSQLSREARRSQVKPTPELANEGYILQCSYSRQPDSERTVPSRIRIQAVSAAGFHNALLRVPELLAKGASELSNDLIPAPQSLRVHNNGKLVIIADYPSFVLRGVVEGFYGPPWSHADRLELMRFEGQHSLNIYIYGPKDDPYHRKRWREPYPPDQLKRLGELADTARENFVDFSFAISPGLSMVYSSEADFQSLARKLDTVGQLGVSNFALFLDDVPQDLTQTEDKAHFKTLAEAHAHLINRLYDHLKSLSPSNRLTVCPTIYTNGWGNRDYIKELGAKVNPAVPLYWTGIETIPPAITSVQAEEWSGYIHRKPLVWDNYPVNDDNPWWLNLDPLRRRDTGLYARLQGLVSNPMVQPTATMIPLQTVADYLWNPPAYDPEKSQRHAVVSQYGADAPELLAPLLRIFSPDRGDGLAFRSIFEESWNPIDVPAVELQTSRLITAITTLRDDPRFGPLIPELSSAADLIGSRLSRVQADPMLAKLADGKLQWDPSRDPLKAFKVTSRPVLDGDFAKWESVSLNVLNDESQIAEGKALWKGASQFSVRVALGWDEENLYIGVDATDPDFYQPFWGREAENGDAIRLMLDTAHFQGSGPGKPVDAYDLYLSPGDFAGVKSSIYCDEDYLPARPRPHDYNKEIQAVWKRTSKGFSGDVAIPVSFFTRDGFATGQEISLSFGAQKTLPPTEAFGDDPKQIVFTSKRDPLFRVDTGNPATLQRLFLVDEPTR